MTKASLPSITSKPFGITADGERATLYTLRNSKGATATISNYGGTVTSLSMPDLKGLFSDVVLGFKTLTDYEKQSPYFGCLIGRFGNRIANGTFSLEGQTYHVSVNNRPNSLHGGVKGFDKVVWKATSSLSKRGPSLKLTHISPDGEQGYPGNLSVTATYTLTERNELKLVYHAKTDRTTIVNLTHHSYFNLLGHGKGDILDHVLTLHAGKFIPVNKDLIPTGKILSVKGTPLDFSKPTAIGSRVNDLHQQLVLAKGYDHTWVADKLPGRLGLIAKVEEAKSGRVMKVFSTQPGFQLYTGNSLDGSFSGKEGKVYDCRSGLCIEPQHYPDSPNHKNFPTTVLKRGETYKNTIIYRFSTTPAKTPTARTSTHS